MRDVKVEIELEMDVLVACAQHQLLVPARVALSPTPHSKVREWNNPVHLRVVKEQI